MLNLEAMTRRFETVFEAPQATVLAQTITEAYNDLVKTSDFNELKAILARLAAAQERTEVRVGALAEAQERLSAAQERTEGHLAKLARTVDSLAEELGGLSRGMSYALENEA